MASLRGAVPTLQPGRPSMMLWLLDSEYGPTVKAENAREVSESRQFTLGSVSHKALAHTENS